MALEPLPPEDIEGAAFATALRGYDRKEVDDFLSEVASQQRALLDELVEIKQSADNAYLDFGREVGRVLQQAKSSADQILGKAEEDSAKLREEAARTAEQTIEESRRRADEMRAAAERDALERIRDADEKVQRLQETELDVRQRLHSWRDMLRTVGEQIERAEAEPTVGVGPEGALSPPEGDGAQADGSEDRAQHEGEKPQRVWTPAEERGEPRPEVEQAVRLRPGGDRGDGDAQQGESWRPSGTEDGSPNL